ncbi:hypothetical protein HHI36_017989 [Cryptolaemus montrouzieri]|uniref:S-adenosylmethionine sensor upstream of mTORC1 n=1 Tax=Cryptolaemus montrouzieri TaxID=559131 RepID=A0ABD2NYX8_9CUCU
MQMACSDHIKLSTFIKSVHSNLREKSKSIGFQEAWKEHCRDEQTLEEYAKAMKELAISHWQNNFEKNNSKAISRVEWIYKYCLEYFYNDEAKIQLLRQREREFEIASKMEILLEAILLTPEKCLKLLDVGSCYNPFARYDIFDVLAVDIAPSNPDVYKMDFLTTNIDGTGISENNLPIEHFEIVVFSLFLEYLPTPDLRIQSCMKAYKLLKPEGLLFIITPDSKHVGANAQVMKSWRYILAKIGFSRVRYEKLSHIHCMAFRKSLDKRIAERWADLHENYKIYDKIYIPQELQTKQNTVKTETSITDNKVLFDIDSELPFSSITLMDDIR